jgi:plasmid stabilization system protein ParE
MTVVYHPAVQKDVNGILRYYERVSPHLADEFWDELLRIIELILENPNRSHPANHDLRRSNLRRFPYHVLFRQRSMTVRIIAVRHHKRHPSMGGTRR